MLFATLLLTTHAFASNPSILGLNPIHLLKYTDKTFVCDQGTKSLRASVINDDYCDCFDGSDEVGTSACGNSIFYCHNIGFIPKSILSSRVGDGICDCCDGSDEQGLNTKLHKSCTDTCKEEALLDSKQKENMKHTLQRAQQIKKEYLTFASENSRRFEIESLKSKVGALSRDVKSIEVLRDAARDYENAAQKLRNRTLIRSQRRECPGKLDAAAKRLRNVHATVYQLTDHLSHLYSIVKPVFGADDDDAADSPKDKDPSALSGLSEACFNDPVLINAKSQWASLNIDEILAKTRAEDANDNINSAEETDDASDLKDDYDACEDSGAPMLDCLAQGVTAIKDNIIGVFYWNGWKRFSQPISTLISNTMYGRFPLRSNNDLDDAEARNALSKDSKLAQAKIDQINAVKAEKDARLDQLEKLEKIDFGPLSIYEKLYNECIQLDTPEYIYEICLFERVTQKPKNGGADTEIGIFKRWGSRSLDSDAHIYSSMMYEDGAQCWNGPKRSVEVSIECGDVNAALSVSEPSKCEYFIRITSPAACGDISQSSHDEL